MYAVLIPWVKTKYGKALLMEVRSDKVKQPGEVCFPGGRAEPGETAEQTAVRETCEELGIDKSDIEIIRVHEPLIMGDGREVHVAEAAIDVSGIEDMALSADEVSEVFLLPEEWLKMNRPVHYELSLMTDDEIPAKLLSYLSNYGSYRQYGETDYLEYDGHGIWGLTARIICMYLSSGQDC